MGHDPGSEKHSSVLEPEIVDIEHGLQFAHLMMMVTQDQSHETLAFVKALAEVLTAKGLISEEEMAEPLARTRQEIAELTIPRVRLGNMGDKYADEHTVDIDCASRIHLCKARCCAMRFFLTKQDLDEGVAKWDYGNPYFVRQSSDGYCVHWDREHGGCTIHAQRPHICRQYDCRNDKRVWLDFEKRIPAPMPDNAGQMPVAMVQVAQRDDEAANDEN